MTVGKYNVAEDSDYESHKLTVRVTSTYGNRNHYADRVDSGEFAYTAAEAGDYMACFWAVDYNPQVTVTIDFDWRTGVQGNDWSNGAKKGSVDVMELELKKLSDSVNSIHQEMFYLRYREEGRQELNRVTNSRIAWFSGLSLLICLTVAGMQLWHLKTFFEKKKLI